MYTRSCLAIGENVNFHIWRLVINGPEMVGLKKLFNVGGQGV